MSPSDLKQVEAALWVEQGHGKPTLMPFSAVDGRSGVVYDETRCVYREDVDSALRFLFNATAFAIRLRCIGRRSRSKGAEARARTAAQGYLRHDLHGQGPGQPLEGVPVRDGQPRRARAYPHSSL